MKTVRISYATKLAATTDEDKNFTVVSSQFVGKVPGISGVAIDDTTFDMLVPDNFDVSTLGGTIVIPDRNAPLHEFLGHRTTKIVSDKAGTLVDGLTPAAAVDPPKDDGGAVGAEATP